MIKAVKVAALTALALLNEAKPQAYVQEFRPSEGGFVAPVEHIPVKKVTTPRKKHVCRWSDQEVWGAVFFALLIGIFIGYCI